MEYRYLGNSGLKVSVLSFGNMTSGLQTYRGLKDVLTPELEQTHFEYIEKCIGSGINFFDTSEVYGDGVSEEVLGLNLKRGGWDRDELVISTKIHPQSGGIQGNSRKRMRASIQNQLKRLQLEYVDLLFLHRIDLHVPLIEQLKTINEFVENDLTFYWGTCEFNAAQLSETFYLCDKYGFNPPASEQCHYNMLHRNIFEVDYADIFDRYRLGAVAWSPLGGGLLTGKFNDGTIPEDSRFGMFKLIRNRYNSALGFRPNNGAEMLQGLKGIAEEIGCTQSQLALAWVIANKDVSSALFGANSLSHVEENIKSVEVLPKLDQTILNRIEVLIDNRPEPRMNWRTFEKRDYRR